MNAPDLLGEAIVYWGPDGLHVDIRPLRIMLRLLGGEGG